jgi:hypothetical protein
MKNLTKRMIQAGALALGVFAVAPAASAGEWRLNPDRCPDLREDYRDMSRDRGWRDRAEDRRDYRVIECPARAWNYYPSRGERRDDRRYRDAYPRRVYLYSDGRVYERNRRGDLVSLGVNLRLG